MLISWLIPLHVLLRLMTRMAFCVMVAGMGFMVGCTGGSGTDTAQVGADSTAAVTQGTAPDTAGSATVVTPATGTSAASTPAAAKPGPAVAVQPIDTEAGLLQDDAFNLIGECRPMFATRPTFANDLEDLTVNLAGLDRWKPMKTADYAGKYLGPLGSEVAEVTVQGTGPNLTLVISLQAEVASESGEIDYQSFDQRIPVARVMGTTASWGASRAYVTRGQFVQWGSEKGLLLHGRAARKPEFVLLRRVGS